MRQGTRKRHDRTRLVRRPSSAGLESLEGRRLLASGAYYASLIAPRYVDHTTAPTVLAKPIGSNPALFAKLDNEGKVLTGKDRQGDEWSITVHGPGKVIVTDISPNDGVLDDEIDTITIVNSDPRRTYVTGQVTASARVITDGTIGFNHLIAERGVYSILLNGFNLTRTAPTAVEGQPNNVGPEVYLPMGVHYLQFNNIVADIDQAVNDQPFEVVIGAINTPLRQRPNIKIGSIYNSVTDSSIAALPAGSPQTVPTVNFVINGRINNFEAVSVGAKAPETAGLQFNDPVVSTTGRTTLRATQIRRLKIAGGARNLVIARAGAPYQVQNGEAGVPTPIAVTTQPFKSLGSGLTALGTAVFGGPTDGVGIDVDGPIGRLIFNKGIGDSTGVLPGDSNLGYNAAQQGYASFGLLGGLVTAQSIGTLLVGPSSMYLLTANDSDYMQLGRQGSTTYYPQPADAVVSTAVTTDGSIGNIHIVGDSQNSQIATGFSYESYVSGLDPTTGASEITRYDQRGNLIDSVVSASAVPGPSETYGVDTIYGNGSITGLLTGSQFYSGTDTDPSLTALGYKGAGVYALRKTGQLAPPNPIAP